MKRRLILVLLSTVIFLNFTFASDAVMIVNDPAANKQLMAMWSKMVSTYKLIKEQLDAFVEVENTIKDSYQTYDMISNLDVEAIADDFQSGEYFKGADALGKLGALQSESENLVGAGQDNAEYAQDLALRIGNLKRLGILQTQAAVNIKKANKEQRQRDSSKTVAESTSTMAVLQVLDRKDKEAEKIMQIEAQRKEKEAMKETANIFRAFRRSD